jgi:ABC-type siderophore export system fused ATPase/permease subunit
MLPELKGAGKRVVVSHDDRYFHAGDPVLEMDYGQLRQRSRTDDRFASSVNCRESKAS